MYLLASCLNSESKSVEVSFDLYAFLLGNDSYAQKFPDDIHRPACMLHAPAKVRKVVLKIKMSAMFD